MTLGIALLGASPPSRRQQDKGDSPAQSANDAAEIIASAIRKSVLTPIADDGCQRGLDSRSSDLCAQWKAADAARDAADYSLWSLLIGIAGTFLLLATFGETRKIGRREQRAYLRLTVPTSPTSRNLNDGQYRIKVENYGKTPALKAHFQGTCFVSDAPLSNFPNDLAWTEAGFNVVVHPGIPNDYGVPVTLSIEDAILAAQSENTVLYVVGRASYSDVFGGKHIEQICFATRFQQGSSRLEPSRLGNTST